MNLNKWCILFREKEAKNNALVKSNLKKYDFFFPSPPLFSLCVCFVGKWEIYHTAII